MPYTHFLILKYWKFLCLLFCSSSSAEQVEQESNTSMGSGWKTYGPRRKAQKPRHRKAPRTPRPSLPRRSARLQFPGISPPSPPPLPIRRCTRRKREMPFPLMSLPRELRGLIYSKAVALGFNRFKRLLCTSKQVNEEARPYLWKSKFLVLGRGGWVLHDSPGPQPETLLYPDFPDDIRKVKLALHDRVVNNLAMVQNLAVKLDFAKLRLGYRPPMLGQPTAQQRRRARIAGYPPPTQLDRPIGLLEPFLTPQSGSNRRNTCEITLKNFIYYDETRVSQVIKVLARLDNFTKIFVTFESPQLRRPGRYEGDMQRRFNVIKDPLEAAFGPALWREGTGGEGGTLSFDHGR